MGYLGRILHTQTPRLQPLVRRALRRIDLDTECQYHPACGHLGASMRRELYSQPRAKSAHQIPSDTDSLELGTTVDYFSGSLMESSAPVGPLAVSSGIPSYS